MLARIARSAFILASGAIGGQLFVVAASPLLTRLYSPGEFGVLGIYAASLYLVSSIAALRYEVAIPLVKEEADARCLAAISTLFILCGALASGLGVLLLQPLLPQVLADSFLWALPAGVAALGLYNVALYQRLRSRDHALIARTRVLQAISGTTVHMGLGAAGLGAAGLLCGQILGMSTGLSRLKHMSLLRTFRGLTWESALRQLKQQKNFPRYDAPAAILSIANTHGPTIVIGMLFSPAAAGLFALVQRVLITPFALVSNALSASLFSHARGLDAKDTGAYAQRFLASTVVLSPLGAMGAVVASSSFSTVFGAQWEAGRAVAAWLTLFVAQKFIFDSTFSVLAMRQRHKAGMYMQAGVLSVRGAVLVAVGLFFGFDTVLVTFSIVSSLAYYCAAHVSFQAAKPRWLREFMLGAVDWILPYLVVHASLSGGRFEAISLIYALWVGSRIWFYGASLRRLRSTEVAEQ
jgi:O-antigen/teichoic acid export membrane protein